MAYQTGNAATIQVLLGKLADFANGLQWKIKKHTETQLYLSNSREDSHWAIEFLSNNVYTIPCTHFDLEKSAIAQPGSPCIENNAYQKVYTRTTELQNGQFVSYDFFGTSEYLHIVVEIEAERFRHFGIGNLLKEIEFTGGNMRTVHICIANRKHLRIPRYAPMAWGMDMMVRRLFCGRII